MGENGGDRVIVQSGPGIHASVRLIDEDGKRLAAFTMGGGQGERPGYVGINIFNYEGANVLRVHDVKENLAALQVAERLLETAK